MSRLLIITFIVGAATAASPSPPSGIALPGSTCSDLKTAYRAHTCCGAPTKTTNVQVVPKYNVLSATGKTNKCAGAKPTHGNGVNNKGPTDPFYNYFKNTNCTMKDGLTAVLEQAGANVTKGYQGKLNATGGFLPGGTFGQPRYPITTSYLDAGMCPVNVHWHLGAEHYSKGEYDETGSGPKHAMIMEDESEADGRRKAVPVRLGFQCKHYDKNDPKFTKPYEWKHCDKSMTVGETYEVHWPHSKLGACGTPDQYQYPFYDGVFCNLPDPSIALPPNPIIVHKVVGVQSQVYTIVNDESYYYPNLFNGMIIEGEYGKDMAKYTGSTTGTSRDNMICSRFTPITWQVDRKCHLISASSFDKMCADMKQQRDDMSADLHAHGARKLVSDFISANNQVRRDWFPTIPDYGPDGDQS